MALIIDLQRKIIGDPALSQKNFLDVQAINARGTQIFIEIKLKVFVIYVFSPEQM